MVDGAHHSLANSHFYCLEDSAPYGAHACAPYAAYAWAGQRDNPAAGAVTGSATCTYVTTPDVSCKLKVRLPSP